MTTHYRPPMVRNIGYPGRWYVSRNIEGREFSDEYLHSDGVWRGSTAHPGTGEFTGYYQTEAEARAALDRFCRREGWGQI